MSPSRGSRETRASPRTQFDPVTIKELADSIRERGVLQPVLLRPAAGGYQLVAGERRFLATREAGFSTIPAIVRPLTDRESLLIALIENIQRENLNPIDEARAYYRLATEYGSQHDEIGARVGKDRSTVSNIIRFNNLPSSGPDASRVRPDLGRARASPPLPSRRQASGRHRDLGGRSRMVGPRAGGADQARRRRRHGSLARRQPPSARFLGNSWPWRTS